MNLQRLSIHEKSALCFDSIENYNKFNECVLNGNFQKARYYLDLEIINSDNSNLLNDIKLLMYNEIEDLLMDLIINEIDGAERENKQINKNIRL